MDNVGFDYEFRILCDMDFLFEQKGDKWMYQVEEVTIRNKLIKIK